MVADRRLNYCLSWWSYPLLLAGIVALPCWPGTLRADGIKIGDCPKAVQKTIRSEARGGRITEIEKETSAGRVVFEAEVSIDDNVYEVHVSPQGVLLAKILDSPGTPGEEKDDDAGQADDDNGTQKAEDDEDEDDGDDEEDAEQEDEGEHVVKIIDLPKSVRKTLKREARGGEIEEIEREVENGRVVYDVDVEFEVGREELVYELLIREDGVLISKKLETDDEDEDDESVGDDDEDHDDDEGDDEDHDDDEDGA